MTAQYWSRLIFALFFLSLLHLPLYAHEIRPAVVELKIGQDLHLIMRQRVNLEALLAGIGSEHKDTDQSVRAAEYNKLRQLPPAQLEAEFVRFLPRLLAGSRLLADGNPVALKLSRITIAEVGDIALARDSLIELTGNLPSARATLVWRWELAFGANVLRVDGSDGKELYSTYLLAGDISEPISLSSTLTQSNISLFFNYLVIGFHHILPKGADHILFVVGLFLLNARLSALLWQVSSFTLAHTLTLGLGIYGVVQMPAAIVEPLIAASIVYVCVENLFSDRLTKWRPLVVFMFGLLHGLGFAGVLREVGLAPEHFLTGLIAFNLGVELGQLTVISGCFLAVGLWFSRKSWYRRIITVPASLVIASIGGFWFLQRIGSI